MKVLVVDDDFELRRVLMKIMEIEKYEAIDADDGDVAIAKYLEFKPDVVIMDSVMSNMSGLDASKEILKQDPNARIILLTGYDDTETVTDFLEVGISYFLAKPVGKAKILNAIKEVLS